MVYFDARTKLHLQAYLESRNDDNPALIVSLKAPFKRLSIGGVETRLRELGRQLGVHKVHPHKFRRTLATLSLIHISLEAAIQFSRYTGRQSPQ